MTINELEKMSNNDLHEHWAKLDISDRYSGKELENVIMFSCKSYKNIKKTLIDYYKIVEDKK